MSAIAAPTGFDSFTTKVSLLSTVVSPSTATATVLPDPPKGLQLQPIQVDGLTDYIGVFAARPPATVEFRVTAVRNGWAAITVAIPSMPAPYLNDETSTHLPEARTCQTTTACEVP